MPLPRFGLALLCSALLAVAAPAELGAVGKGPVAADAESDINSWTFNLLPKSMQKDPDLRMTVICEMTDAGRKQREVTPKDPAYYIPVSSGYQEIGDEVIRTQPDPKIVAECVRRALKGNGFLPASKEHPASLVIAYSWGAFGWTQSESVSEQMAFMVKRAAFVGGQRFAEELKEAARRQIDANEIHGNIERSLAGHAEDANVMNVSNTLNMVNFAAFHPWNLFKEKSRRNEWLVDQVAEPLYYVVVSAYDAQSVARNNRILLWRTYMTVELGALAMRDCIPSLVAQGSRYLGRDMQESATLTRKAYSNVETRIGELEFMGYDEAQSKKGKK